MGRFLLTVLAAVLFGLGWFAGRLVFVTLWCWSAIKVGWSDGRKAVTRGSAT